MLKPVTLNQSHRAFSLWPTTDVNLTATTNTDEATLSSSLLDSPAPYKPTMADLSMPTSLPDPTFFEPASAVLLSLAPTLGISYALLIPLLTLAIRGSLTLPLTLWQRARTRKFADVVMPLLRKEQTRISFETRNECRRAGKSFEEYQEVYKKRVSAGRWDVPKLYVLQLNDGLDRSLTSCALSP